MTFSRFAGVRAVLFDFDDTLVQSSVADARALDATLAEFAPAFPRGTIEDLRVGHEEILLDVKRVFRDTGAWAYPPERFARLAAAFGTPESLAEAMGARYFVARVESIRPFAGALEAVAELRARGFRVGVVTNAPARTQRAAIEASGFAPLLDAVAIAGEEGVRKPDVRLFALALDRLGVPAEGSVVVGDSFGMDMVPARKLGAGCVFVAGAPGDARSRLFDDDVVPPVGSVDAVVARAADVLALL